MRNRTLLVLVISGLTALAGIIVWRGRVTVAPSPTFQTHLSSPIALVDIPAGEFMMGITQDEVERDPGSCWGCSTCAPSHLVRITYDFKMGKYEVTQKQWCEVMGITIQQLRDRAQREQLAVAPEPLSGEGEDYPIYYVSWDMAMEFCARLTEYERTVGRLPESHEYRLPTEAEWEYACRAGSTTRFANGDTEADLDAIGWYRGNSGGTSHPVGIKPPNAWNLHDMHGNISEWCWDWWDDCYPPGNVNDPTGPDDGAYRVLRGGNWHSDASSCRSADRNNNQPSCALKNFGFRVVLAPTPTSAPP